MAAVQSYRELLAWQKAMDLSEVTYRLTEAFPKREMFCLTSQLRRCAVSVPSNIAEGQGRDTVPDFLRFLSVARGSLQELETQFELAYRLRYFGKEPYDKVTDLSAEVKRLVNGLSRALRDNRGVHPRSSKD